MPGTGSVTHTPPNSYVVDGESKLKQYSWDEISKHNKEHDCWIVVKGQVYDVTNWVGKHPGGRIILNGAGREATALFMSYHPTHVYSMIDKYRIGSVLNYQSFYQWDSSDFYPVVKSRVEQKLKELNFVGRESPVLYFKTFLIFVTWITLYYLSMISGHVWLAIPLGVIHSQIGINIAHDGAHGAYSRNRIIKRITSYGMDIMGGCSVVWQHQHNIGHHPNCNKHGDALHASKHDNYDPDASSGAPWVRITPNLPWRPMHRYQHIYIWILTLAMGLKWFVNDIRGFFFRRRYMSFEFYETSNTDWWVQVLTKVAFLTYAMFIPASLHPFSTWFPMFLMFTSTISYMFVLMFSVNHLTENTLYPNTDEKSFPINTRDWAMYQVRTTSNFATQSLFWTWFSGSLNHQIEHHLFPGITHTYLPYIQPIVKQTCLEYNLPYKDFPSYWDAFASYYYHIKRCGQQPTVSNSISSSSVPPPSSVKKGQ